MGRIKTQMIKRLTQQLIKEKGDKLTKEFETNKPIVEANLSQKSKKLRNKIAGYVTRLMKK